MIVKIPLKITISTIKRRSTCNRDRVTVSEVLTHELEIAVDDGWINSFDFQKARLGDDERLKLVVAVEGYRVLEDSQEAP